MGLFDVIATGAQSSAFNRFMFFIFMLEWKRLARKGRFLQVAATFVTLRHVQFCQGLCSF